MQCPICGSREVAAIMYGLPRWDEKLEEGIKNRKVVLGGCCVTNNDPRYYCFSCEKKICYPSSCSCEDVDSIRFFKSGPGMDNLEVAMERKDWPVYTLTVNGEVKCQRRMAYKEWDAVVRKIFKKFYIAEWKNDFNNPEVPDGEKWELEIGREKGEKIKYSGSSAHPPYWEELNDLFKIYFEGSAELPEAYKKRRKRNPVEKYGTVIIELL